MHQRPSIWNLLLFFWRLKPSIHDNDNNDEEEEDDDVAGGEGGRSTKGGSDLGDGN